MNRIVPIAALLLMVQGCALHRPKYDPHAAIRATHQPFFPRYSQHGTTIDAREMANKLAQEPASKKLMQSSARLRVAAVLISAVGGALIGWPLGRKLAGDEPNWNLAYGGLGAVGIAIPFGIGSDIRLGQAVQAHNRAIDGED